MKIALLLRGQLRNVETGIHILQKTLLERYPQHEFRIFLHGWTTRPKKYTYSFSTSQFWQLEEIPQDELDNYIDLINPSSYEISSPKELSHFINYDILPYTHNDENLIQFLKNQHESIGLKKCMMHLYTPFETKKQHEKWLLEMNYILGQHYSAAKSHEIYYNSKLETGWTADLVLLTRTDIILKSDYDVWNNWFEDVLNNQIDPLVQRGRSPVLVRGLVGKGTTSWFCDMHFIMRDHEAQMFFSTKAKKKFREIFIKNKLNVMPMLLDPKGLRHTLWGLIGGNVHFFEGGMPPKTLIRGNFALDKDFDKNMSIDKLFWKCKEVWQNAPEYNDKLYDEDWTIEDAKKLII